MKTIELSDATEPLATYAVDAKSDPVLITRRGKPVAALVPMEGMDRESASLSINPKFIAIIERARASRRKGTISSDEMRRRLGLPPAKAKTTRKRNA
jgi:prevent-host-death family protein